MNPLFSFDGVRQIPEDALDPPLDDCPLCAGCAWRPVFTVQQAPVVTLNHCETCHGSSVSRMPRPEALAAFYASFYEGNEEEHVTFDGVVRFGAHLFQYARALSGRGALHVVDFGGGDGAIAASLADRLVAGGASDVKVSVVDFGVRLAQSDSSAVELCRVGALDDIAAGSADIVLASGVLEHVPDPLDTLGALLLRLNRGGMLYARTPHVLPFMRLRRRGAVERFFPFPAHLHDLGENFWNHCLGRVNEGTEYRLAASRPAIVQASFRRHFRIALASHLVKAPWWILGGLYPFVGGWEVVVRRG